MEKKIDYLNKKFKNLNESIFQVENTLKNKIIDLESNLEELAQLYQQLINQRNFLTIDKEVIKFFFKNK